MYSSRFRALAGSTWQFTIQKNLDHYNGNPEKPVRACAAALVCVVRDTVYL